MNDVWAMGIVALLLVLMGLVGCLLALRIKERHANQTKGVVGLEDEIRSELDLQRTTLPQLEDILPGTIGAGDLLAVMNPLDTDQVMIFGETRAAESYGEILGPIPRQLSAVAVGIDAMAKAGMAMGEQAGMLVRLTPESAKNFRELQKTIENSGAVLAVLRGSSGKFAHVVRFKPAVGLQAISGISGTLSAIAMQAQLAAIEKAIAEVAEDVRRVQLTLDIQATSRLTGVSEVLQDVYLSSRATGVLTQSAWDQIAPLAAPVFTNRDYADRRLRALLEELAGKKSTADRRNWFKKNQSTLIESMLELEEAERAVVQYAGLRLWWLTSTNDPALGHYAQDLHDRLAARATRRTAVESSVRETVTAAGEVTWFSWTHSPFDSGAAQRAANRLMAALINSGLLSLQEVQMLTSESPPGPLEALPAKSVEVDSD